MQPTIVSSMVESPDLVPLIFSFLPPSAYLASSLVCCLWEMVSRPYLFQHITALQSLSFTQCIALFTGNREIPSYVRSFCFHHSVQPPMNVDDHVDLFIQYAMSTCHNLVSITFWNIPIKGNGFSLLHPYNPVRVLTFQNCTFDYDALLPLLSACTNLKLLQFANRNLFINQSTYHGAHLNDWITQWGTISAVLPVRKPRPFALLIQSPRESFPKGFWSVLLTNLDYSGLEHLKLHPHTENAAIIPVFMASCLPYITHLETSCLGESFVISMTPNRRVIGSLPLASAARLTHLRLDTVWGTREITQPTLTSLHSVDSLTTIVIVFYVGTVVDEIMRAVVSVLEDLKTKQLSSITFLFKRLAHGSTQTNFPNIPDILPTVREKMRETFLRAKVVKADWLCNAKK